MSLRREAERTALARVQKLLGRRAWVLPAGLLAWKLIQGALRHSRGAKHGDCDEPQDVEPLEDVLLPPSDRVWELYDEDAVEGLHRIAEDPMAMAQLMQQQGSRLLLGEDGGIGDADGDTDPGLADPLLELLLERASGAIGRDAAAAAASSAAAPSASRPAGESGGGASWGGSRGDRQALPSGVGGATSSSFGSPGGRPVSSSGAGGNGGAAAGEGESSGWETDSEGAAPVADGGLLLAAHLRGARRPSGNASRGAAARPGRRRGGAAAAGAGLSNLAAARGAGGGFDPFDPAFDAMFDPFDYDDAFDEDPLFDGGYMDGYDGGGYGGGGYSDFAGDDDGFLDELDLPFDFMPPPPQPPPPPMPADAPTGAVRGSAHRARTGGAAAAGEDWGQYVDEALADGGAAGGTNSTTWATVS